MSAVNHPAHYGGDTTYEAVKVIEAWSLPWHLGDCVKYIARHGKKDPAKTIEDLHKARWYLDRYIALLEAAEKPEEPAPVEEGAQEQADDEQRYPYCCQALPARIPPNWRGGPCYLAEGHEGRHKYV